NSFAVPRGSAARGSRSRGLGTLGVGTVGGVHEPVVGAIGSGAVVSWPSLVIRRAAITPPAATTAHAARTIASLACPRSGCIRPIVARPEKPIIFFEQVLLAATVQSRCSTAQATTIVG